MFKKLALIVALAAVICGFQAGLASADMIVNGGFETGDFTGWTVSNAVVYDGSGNQDYWDAGVLNNGSAHAGNYEAYLGKAVNLTGGSLLDPGTISQSFATTKGQAYTISFYVANDGGVALPGYNQNGTSLFQALWNGNITNPNLVDSPAFGYTLYSYTGIATGDTSTISFAFQHDTSTFRLDDVSATSAVPIPGAVWLFGSGLIGLIGLKRKSLG